MQISKFSFRISGLMMIILAVLSGCMKNKTVAKDSVQPLSTEERTEPIETLVMFVSGEAHIITSSGERLIDIGDMIASDDRIITGSDGYVELQVGDFGAVRINHDTEYQLETATFSSEKIQVSGALASGSIIAKVKKLSEKDVFEVNVPGAVCAVRGTQFLVKADQKGFITVAVNDGGVYIGPPSLATKGKYSQYATSIAQIRSLMILVDSSKEVNLDTEVFQKVETELASWKEEDTAINIDVLSKKFASSLESIPLAMTAISEENLATITEVAPSLLNVSLSENITKKLASLTAHVSPYGTRLFFNGRFVGYNYASQVFRSGDMVEVQAHTSDGRIQSKTVEAGTQSVVNIVFNESKQVSEPLPQKTEGSSGAELLSVDITAEPKNASIWVDGKLYGQGSIEITGTASSHYNIFISAPGYYSMEETRVTLRPDEPTVQFSIEPHTIVNRIPLTGKGIGTPVAQSSYAVVATADGTLTALKRNGGTPTPIWLRETGNSSAKYMSPTIINNTVYAIGSTNFIMIDLPSGNIIHQGRLDRSQKNHFGQRIVKVGKRTIIPVDKGFEIINEVTGQTLKTVEIAEAPISTPNAWKGKILIANQQGTLLLINSQDFTVESEIDTGTVQAIGLAPVVVGDMAFIAGKQGMVSAINLDKKLVAWKRPLMQGEVIQVYSDIVATEDTAYVYGNGTVFALALQGGRDRFQPIEGASAPPMVHRRFLYISRDDDTIAILNRMNGIELGSIPLGDKVEVRPVPFGDYILAVGEESAIIIDARSITNR